MAYNATRRLTETSSRRYAEFRGVSAEKFEQVSKAIMNLLKGREMTASQIRKTLRTELDVSAILYLMCDQGLLIKCRSEEGWNDKNNRYSLFSEYFPDLDLTEISEIEARTLLVQYYLSSFGSVTENDIAWWIGLNKTEIREALSNIQKQTTNVEISDLKGNFIMLQPDERPEITGSEKKTVNLLPGLDPYLMGYKERERYLNYECYDNVFDHSGNATSTILLDGRVVGIWDFAEDLEQSVKIFLLEEVEGDMLSEIRLEAKKIGRFIVDKEVRIKECDSMIPLTQRTAGGVMSPLKDS